jgi:hypothetical protein
VTTPVRLDRTTDRLRPCHDNLATIIPRTDGVHAADLRCTVCNRHRGFLARAAFPFLAEINRLWGTPQTPVLRDRHVEVGDAKMNTQAPRDNAGALFRNTKKTTPQHADYNGSIVVAGTEFWINGWIKEAKTGMKYMSLAVKPKPEETAKRPIANPSDDMADEINF